MHSTPLDVLVTAYPIEEGAEAALRDLARAAEAGSIHIRAAVTLRKDASNDLHIVDTAPRALLEGIGGVVVGVIAGSLSWDRFGAMCMDKLASRLQDGGFWDELRGIGRRLPAGWSAIVTVVEHRCLREAERLLEERAVGAEGPGTAAGLTATD